MNIYFFSNCNTVYFNLTDNIFNGCTQNEFLKYLRTRYTNFERFKNNFINPAHEMINRFSEMKSNDNINNTNRLIELLDKLVELYPDVKPFTYKEAFSIQTDEFRALVFGSIRVPEMIKEMGSERIKVAGHPVKHKKFDKEGNFLGFEEYDVIYETHKVNGNSLGIEDDLCAVKCWCTTTNNEHWLWVDEKHINDPLEAIASTFMVHESLIPYIKELKRQGDILLVELSQDVEPKADDKMVSLTKEQYFSLLTAQS